MNRELLWQTRYVRGVLALTIFLGVLAAAVTVLQMAFLSKIVNQVFWVHQSLYQFVPLIILLLGSIVLHAGLVWLRGMVAQHGAIRAKSELRERLFAHLRSEEHTSELQSRRDLVCRLLLEKKN